MSNAKRDSMAEKYYPDELIVSGCAYDDDFMRARTKEKLAFKTGWDACEKEYKNPWADAVIKSHEYLNRIAGLESERDRLKSALVAIDSETWILTRFDLDRLLGIVKKALGSCE